MCQIIEVVYLDFKMFRFDFFLQNQINLKLVIVTIIATAFVCPRVHYESEYIQIQSNIRIPNVSNHSMEIVIFRKICFKIKYEIIILI